MIEVNGSRYGKRADGTEKGAGFLGPLAAADGSVMTELSIGIEFDGENAEVPLLVPTLTTEEIELLRSGADPTEEIVNKSVEFARQRKREGKPYFATEDEIPASGKPMETDIAAPQAGYSVMDPIEAIASGQLDIYQPTGASAATSPRQAEYYNALRTNYPRFADQISRSEQAGHDAQEVARLYTAMEGALQFGTDGDDVTPPSAPHTQAFVDQIFGRTPRSMLAHQTALYEQEKQAYHAALGYTKSREEIDELFDVSRISGVSPYYLNQYPEAFAYAQKIAGNKMRFLDYFVRAGQEIKAGNKEMNISARASRLSDFWARMDRDANDMAMINRESMAAYLRENWVDLINTIDTWDQYRIENMNYREQWGVLGTGAMGFLNSLGFSTQSLITSAAGNALGSLVGGAIAGPPGAAIGAVGTQLLASGINTNREANAEAGTLMIERIRMDMQRGIDVTSGEYMDRILAETREDLVTIHRNNVLLLGATNTVQDMLALGLGPIARRLTTQSAKNTLLGGAARTLRRPVVGIMQSDAYRAASSVFRRPLVRVGVGAALEGVEEGGQSAIVSYARDGEVDMQEVWESAALGTVIGLGYMGIGAGIRKTIQIAAQPYRRQAAVDQETINNMRDAQATAERVANGDIDLEDIVSGVDNSPYQDWVFVNIDRVGEVISETGANPDTILEGYGFVDAIRESEAQVEEYAISPAEWTSFSETHPEIARVLSEKDMRQGPKGVTAREQMAQGAAAASRLSRVSLLADTQEAAAAREYAQTFRESLAAIERFDEQYIEDAGTMYGQMILSLAEGTGLDVSVINDLAVQEGIRTGNGMSFMQSAYNARGSMSQSGLDGSWVMGIGDTANASTPIHEMWHWGLDKLLTMGNQPGAEPWFNDMRNQIIEFYGLQGINTDRLPTLASENPELYAYYVEAQEDFARGGELFMASGKAPTAELQGVFTRLRNLLLNLVEDLRRLFGKTSEALNDIYSKLLAAPIENNEAFRQNTTVADLYSMDRKIDRDLSENAQQAFQQEGESLISSLRQNPISAEDLANYGELLDNLPVGIDSFESTLTLEEAAAQRGMTVDQFVDALITEQANVNLEVSLLEETAANRRENADFRRNVMDLIRENGGIDYAAVRQSYGAQEAKQLRASIGPSLFSRKNTQGLGLDRIAQVLNEAGFSFDNDADLYRYLMEGREQSPEVRQAYDKGVKEGRAEARAEIRDLNAETRSLTAEYRRLLKEGRKEATAAAKARINERLANLEQRLRKRFAQQREGIMNRVREMQARERERAWRDRFIRDEATADERTGRREAEKEVDRAIRLLLRGQERQAKTEAKASKWQQRYQEATERVWRERFLGAEKLRDARAQQQNKNRIAREKKRVRSLINSIIKASKSKGIYAGARQEIAQMLAEQKAKGKLFNELRALHEIDPEINDMLTPEEAAEISQDTYKNILGMTLTQLEEFASLVKAIRDTGAEKLRMIQADKRARQSAISQQILTRQKALNERLERKGKPGKTLDYLYDRTQISDKEYWGLTGKASQFRDWLYSSTLKMSRLADWFDQGKGTNSGPIYDLLIRQSDAAEDLKLRNIEQRLSRVENFMQENKIDERYLAQVRNIEGHDIKIDHLLHIYAAMKNNEARAALVANFSSYNDVIGFLDAATKSLTQTEKELADAVLADYDINFDRANQVLMDVYNTYMQKVDFYTPMYHLAHGNSAQQSIKAGLLGMSLEQMTRQNPDKSFSISRQTIADEFQTGLRLGLVEQWLSAVKTQEHMIAFGQLIQDQNAIFNRMPTKDEITSGMLKASDSIANLVRQNFGRQAWDTMQAYRALVTNNDRINPDAIFGFLTRLSRGSAVTYIAWNFGTMLRNTTAIFRGFGVASPRYMFSSIAKFMTQRQAFLDRIYEADPQMKTRKGSWAIQALQELRQQPDFRNEMVQRFGEKYEAFISFGFDILSTTDRWVSAIVWQAAYDTAIRSQNVSVRQATQIAQDAVKRTMQPVSARELPQLWRLGGPGGSAIRFLMLFTTDLAQEWGILSYDLPQAIRRKDIKSALGMTLGISLAAMAMQAFRKGLPDEDDEEGVTGWMADAFANQTIGMTPFVGKGLIAGYDMLRGNPVYYDPMGPFVAPVSKLIRGINRAKDDKPDNNVGAIWDVAEAMSLMGAPAFPVTQARRLYNAANEAKDNEETAYILAGLIGQRREKRKKLQRFNSSIR